MGETFATSVALNLALKLHEHLFAPIGRQFGYMLHYKSYIDDLENGVKELEIEREGVQSSVDEAVYNGKPIHKDVENWLMSVNEEIEKADNLLSRNKSAKDACFCGWLPNPLVRHPIGKKVKKMTQVIRGLHDESKNSIFQVFYENTPIGIVTATTSPTRSILRNEDVLESRASITEDVIKAITDDKVHVIGVFGPGGVGKSKLMEDVERRVKEEQLFDVVASANVSRIPDLKRIQGEIADALGLNLVNVETVRGRADCLHKRLESHSEKKILIILDNLWMKIDLKEVGIPCGYDNKVKGCKLLLTSRYRDVLYIDMSSDQEFQLNVLMRGEARILFERTVGDRVNDPRFKNLVDRVVENCGGLPLLILSVAKRLKRGDLPEWSNASIITDESSVKSIVEISYNDLKDERIKSLFLVLALPFGRCSIRETLMYCMGLGLYKNFSKSIEHARDRLSMDLRNLHDSSLLVGNDDLKQLSVHDLFIDVALSMHDKFIDTEWNALVGRKDLKEWSKYDLRKCTAMAVDYVGIDELPEKLDCPNMRILLLFESNPSLKMPESFFESMEKLQVLDLSGLSFTSLPSSMELLENLTSLCLNRCHLEDATALGKLKGLQFLSFIDSTIVRLPKEIGELRELRFLDLTGCSMLKVIDPGVLESLVSLEELYMEHSFDQWEAEDETPRSNASLAELENMKKLSTLFITIPHPASLSRDLPFGKLNKHKIQIGGTKQWWGENKESRTLKLKLDSDILLHEVWMQKCLMRTEDLSLDGLQDGRDSIHDLCTKGFQNLKHLHVENSPSLQYVVHSTEEMKCTAFTRLESLFLKNLNNLAKIFHGRLARESFSKLKIVKLDNCSEIKHLFPSPMMRIFSQLEDIEISRCHLIKQIIADAEVVEDGDEIDVDAEVKPYNLCRLTLQCLPEMTSFYKTTDHSVVLFDRQQLIKLQNLEAITIERCQFIREVFDLEELTTSEDVKILWKLTRLTLSSLPSLEHIWNKNPKRVLCFQNLKALKVQNCENLRFLFSSSMAKALVQIKEIEIVSCILMEEIMYVQEEELEEATTTDSFEFPLLTSLSLEELPNLKTFSYGRKQSMTANIGLQQAFGRINSGLPLHGFFNEKVLFPSLEELKLSSMCQLKRIWHNEFHEQSFCKLASLTIELCENLSHVFPSNSMDRFPSMNKIEVVGCPSLEALFESVSLSSERRQKPVVLSALKRIKLLNLPRLRDILKSDCKVTWAFPSLMEMNVRLCHSLSYLFSSATAKTLHELVVLDVSSCNNMRGIIAMEEGKGETIETFEFRHLIKLKLKDLKSLICFSSESCTGDGLYPLFDEKLAFPKLEELHLEGVQQKEMWNDKINMESFCCLKILKVKQCHNLMNVIPSSMWKRLLHCMESLTVEKCQHLKKLFTMSMAKNLGQLRYLGLGGCGEIEYIVAKEEEKPEEVANKIVIPQLITLYLHNMPKLRSFCQEKHISEWPSLTEFTIEDCKAVKVILEDADCRKLEGSVPTHQPLLLVEKVEFPSLESMKILHMDNMEKIWLDDLDSNAFGKLKTLVVEYCEKLLSIYSSYDMLSRFQNLEKITVTNCGSLEVVFQVQEFKFSEACSTNTFQLRELVLTRLPKMKHVWSGLPQGGLTFGRLKHMKVVKCESLKSIFPRSVAKSMTRLEELLVWDCGVEEIIAKEDGVGMNASDLFFPQLADLRLLELPKLRSFYQNSHTSAWPLLKQLRVRHCGKMRSFSFACEFQSYQGTTTNENQSALFSFEKVIPHLEGLTLSREDAMMTMHQHYVFENLRQVSLGCYHDENVAFWSNFLLHRFPNLEMLNVICSSFNDIFPEDSSRHGTVTCFGELVDMEKPHQALRNLRHLELEKLCNLERVWKDGSLMAEILKQIEHLFILECSSLPIVFPSRISCQRLKQLNVEDCAGLVHMGTSSAMTSLVHLTWLTLRDCGAMEDVVTDDGNGVEDISFPKLEELILDGLPSLESFSPMNNTFKFPTLKRVIVMKCPKMNIFCKGASRTPNLDKVLLSNRDDEWHWECDLNTTIRTLSA